MCGKDYLPYEHWVAGNLSASLSQNPLDNEIVVVLGSLLEFKNDEEVVIFHLLQPMNKGMLYISCTCYFHVYMLPLAYGKITKVTDQYCLVKLTDDDSSSSLLRTLVQQICEVLSVVCN